MNYTSPEISKKLLEAGFLAKTRVIAFAPYENSRGSHTFSTAEISRDDLDISRGEYPAYDLETLIKGLPPTIQLKNQEYRISVHIDEGCLWASYKDKYRNILYARRSSCSDNFNLADEVALLWLDVVKTKSVLSMNLFYFLNEAPISVRLYNCLKNEFNQDSLVSDLIMSGKSRLLCIHNFGKKSFNELEELLSEYNLHFTKN